MRRFRTLAIAFVAALLAVLVVMPFILGQRCQAKGGHFIRETLICEPG